MKISVEEYINTSFCFDCPDCRDDCGDFCGLYQYLVDESDNKYPDEFCEKCNDCNCEQTSLGCMLHHVHMYKLIHARDVILERRHNERVDLEHNGVTIHELQ